MLHNVVIVVVIVVVILVVVVDLLSNKTVRKWRKKIVRTDPEMVMCVT